MIIVKLLVGNKEQEEAGANSILKNKFTLNVFSSSFDSYHLNSANATAHTQVYVIQFVIKKFII